MTTTNQAKADIEKAIANALGPIAADYTESNMHTYVQYVIACAFGLDMYADMLKGIIDQHNRIHYMNETMIHDRSVLGKTLSAIIKAKFPIAYGELQKYNVLYSID